MRAWLKRCDCKKLPKIRRHRRPGRAPPERGFIEFVSLSHVLGRWANCVIRDEIGLEQIVEAPDALYRPNGGTMVIYSMSWDLPAEPEKLRVYTNLARNDWIPTTLNFEGTVEVATYRNPLQNTPQVLVVIGFTDLPAWQRYIASDEYERIMRDLRILGCSGIMTRVWMPSRLTPDPIRSGDLPLAEPAALPEFAPNSVYAREGRPVMTGRGNA
jgi:hypothetical protein